MSFLLWAGRVAATQRHAGCLLCPKNPLCSTRPSPPHFPVRCCWSRTVRSLAGGLSRPPASKAPPPVSSGSLTARFSSDPGRSHCLGAPRFTHPLLRAPWGRLETALPGAAVCGAWSGAAWGPAHSRHVLQGAPQLAAQVLDVQPLALLHRLSREVHVVHGQLGLIEQPLHHEHRAWGHGSAGPRYGTLLPTPGSGSPRARPAARQAHRPAGCPPRGPEHLPFLEGVPR